MITTAAEILKNMPEHGTVKQFARERRMGIKPCRACQKAENERAAGPRIARGRALEDLRKKYPDEFRDLLNHHREQVGLAPARPRRTPAGEAPEAGAPVL